MTMMLPFGKVKAPATGHLAAFAVGDESNVGG